MVHDNVNCNVHIVPQEILKMMLRIPLIFRTQTICFICHYSRIVTFSAFVGIPKASYAQCPDRYQPLPKNYPLPHPLVRQPASPECEKFFRSPS